MLLLGIMRYYIECENISINFVMWMVIVFLFDVCFDLNIV